VHITPLLGVGLDDSPDAAQYDIIVSLNVWGIRVNVAGAEGGF
jgi:hypothetical protein